MKIVTDSVNGCEYFTAGKMYVVLLDYGNGAYDILSDRGIRTTVFSKNCPHVHSNWRIAEYDEVFDADLISRIGQEIQPEDYIVTPEEEEELNRMEKKQKVTAADIVKAGIKHLEDRASTYDQPEGERSIGATVKAFNAITNGRMDSEEKGWLFMVLLKAVRSQQGDFKMDNYEDGSMYFGLMGESAREERGNGN